MDMQVIMGGGRKYMFPMDTPDVEYPTEKQHFGTRKDGRNLVSEWKERMKEKVSSCLLLVVFFPLSRCSYSPQCTLLSTRLASTTAISFQI